MAVDGLVQTMKGFPLCRYDQQEGTVQVTSERPVRICAQCGLLLLLIASGELEGWAGASGRLFRFSSSIREAAMKEDCTQRANMKLNRYGIGCILMKRSRGVAGLSLRLYEPCMKERGMKGMEGPGCERRSRQSTPVATRRCSGKHG